MKKITRLKKEAIEACNNRGHAMERFSTINNHMASTCCKICGAYAQVNIKTIPNEIEIGGSAVAIGCKVSVFHTAR